MTELAATKIQPSVLLARGALLAAVIALGLGFGYYLIAIYHAATFPFELDYGEGIVWQQMRDIVAGQGYGQIAVFPGLVFHYPPLYHFLTAGFSSLAGLDQLAAGRLLSASSTITTAVIIGLIIKGIIAADGGGRGAWVCGLIGGLSVFSMMPILHWSLFMRVDMVGFLFSFAGLYFGLRALTQPRLTHLAAVCFVAAIFTKQTNIAAPVAVFGTLIALRPRTGFRGIITGVIVSLLALAALIWQTDGGFLRHIISYNINRIDPIRLLQIGPAIGQHILYFGIAGIGAIHLLRRRLPDYRGLTLSEVRGRLACSNSDAHYAMVAAYAVTASLVLLTIIKSGSSFNYFIEWMFVLSLCVGLALRDVGLHASRSANTSIPIGQAVLLPLAVTIQAFLLPNVPQGAWHWEGKRLVELHQLSLMVRNADKPVVSDDMVMLLRSGKPVLFEPAIFAELASGGVWDQRPFIGKIRNHDFAFFITADDRGSPLYDSRYNADVAEAIAVNYPKIRIIADLTVHFPADPHKN